VLASRISAIRVAPLAVLWLALSPIHIVDSSVLLTALLFLAFALPVVRGWRAIPV
jgi:hypothetical protein